MERRDFVRLAIAAGFAPWIGELAFSQGSAAVRIRRSASESAASADVDTLRRGVELLAANGTATEYRSWMYWANSHGTPEDVPPAMAAVWARCEHSTDHFLSWHRAYVFFFESLIRELTQTDTFALPYWDWYSNAEIPAVFATQSIGGKPNPLYHAARRYRKRTLVRDALTAPTFDEFQPSLEGNPHGTVHVMVGGEMGSVPTSARDPLFWAHHANIDRMWEVWLAGDPRRRNPTDPEWLQRRFAYDVQGSKALVVASMLRPSEDLGYRYDSPTPEGHPDVVPARPKQAIAIAASTLASVLSSGKIPIGPVTVSGPTQLSLKGGSVSLDFKVPSVASNKFKSLATPKEGAMGGVVVFDGVVATAEGLSTGADYRIYVNLPEKSDPTLRHQDFYLGSINTFALSHHKDHPQSLRFNLGPHAQALAKLGLWKSGRVSVSLLSDDPDGSSTLIDIKGVRLELIGIPIQ